MPEEWVEGEGEGKTKIGGSTSSEFLRVAAVNPVVVLGLGDRSVKEWKEGDEGDKLCVSPGGKAQVVQFFVLIFFLF